MNGIKKCNGLEAQLLEYYIRKIVRTELLEVDSNNKYFVRTQERTISNYLEPLVQFLCTALF